MPKDDERPLIRALAIPEARGSLVNRLSRVVDRARNIATRLGARPYRVVMVWGKWTGVNRGEGTFSVFREMEILPTPKVSTLDSVTFSVFHAGTIPAGSVKLSEISTRYTADELQGRMVPTLHSDQLPQPWVFYYEVREDGRGDAEPVRRRFRLLSDPTLDAENVQWTLMLERESEDCGRDGEVKYLTGQE